jgi:hypothetical protein
LNRLGGCLEAGELSGQTFGPAACKHPVPLQVYSYLSASDG